MKTIIGVFVLLITFILIFPVFSQNPEWKTYSNGIKVNCIVEEGKYIWGGTTEGLVQIDKSLGTSSFFNTSNSDLSDNNINCLEIDTDGTKWIGTENFGLVKFDGINWSVYDTSNSALPGNNVKCIAVDIDGNKWIGTGGGGLARFDGNTWVIYDTSNSELPDDAVRCISIDNNKNIWISAWTWSFNCLIGCGGVVQIDGSLWSVYRWENNTFPDNRVYCITFDSEGDKWFGTGSGLVQFDVGDWNIYNSGLPDDNVIDVDFDEEGLKWIGTPRGVVRFDGSTWVKYDTSNSELPNNGVNCIVIDSDGNKWIGTNGGLTVFNEGGVVGIQVPTRISTNPKSQIPTHVTLSQNYPNPFNPSTTIEFSLPKSEFATLKIYTLLGQEVATLVQDKLPAGNHTYQFDGSNIASGVYMYRIEAGKYSDVKKMILLQ
jgi:ligand-binding sensor domain-containing protein